MENDHTAHNGKSIQPILHCTTNTSVSTARDGQCSYDMTDDQRKLTYLRDNVEQLQTKAESLQQLLLTVQNSSEAEAAEIFRRIRQPGTNVQFVAEQVQAGQSLYGVGRRDPTRKWYQDIVRYRHLTYSQAHFHSNKSIRQTQSRSTRLSNMIN
jgi:hypothetical protein